MGIFAEIEGAGLKLPAEMKEYFDEERLGAYYKFLKEKNELGGFFSKNDSERILERHLYESLIFAHSVKSWLKKQGKDVSRETKIADAGSGPGLPGFLFACLKNSPALTLIDSSRRRLGILGDWVRESNLFGVVNFLFGRLEETRGTFDLISMRALIPFPFNLELVSGLLQPGGYVALAAGQNLPFDQATKSYLGELGFVSRETLCPIEIQFLGSRFIYLLLRERPAVKGYPRNWKQIKDHMGQWEK